MSQEQKRTKMTPKQLQKRRLARKRSLGRQVAKLFGPKKEADRKLKVMVALARSDVEKRLCGYKPPECECRKSYQLPWRIDYDVPNRLCDRDGYRIAMAQDETHAQMIVDAANSNVGSLTPKQQASALDSIRDSLEEILRKHNFPVNQDYHVTVRRHATAALRHVQRLLKQSQ